MTTVSGLRFLGSAALVATLSYDLPAAAQAPPVTGVCVMYCNAPSFGGMGGMGTAFEVMGIGLSVLGAMQQMQNDAAAPLAAQPGSIAPYQAPDYNTYLIPQLDAVKVSMLRQLRPISAGSYATDPAAAPSTTAALESQRDAILSLMRPVSADAPLSLGGAGVSPGAPIDAQRISVLQHMRPVGNADNPNSAANQLCEAAHQGAGCIGTFTPHGMAAPSASGGGGGATVAAAGNPPAALGAASAAAADCMAISGYQVTAGAMGGSDVTAIVGPCSSGGADEAFSMNARIPFDTPGNQVAGSDAPAVANGTPAMLGGGAPAAVINRATLVADRQSVQRDLCTEIGQLKRRLDGYGQALRRLQATAGNAESARKEWEDRWNEAGNEAYREVPGSFQLLLDVRIDRHIDELTVEMGKVVDRRINAGDLAMRAAQDRRFKDLYDQRQALKKFKDGVAKRTSEAASGAGALSLWQSRDALDGIDQLAQMALDDRWIQSTLNIAPGIGRAKAIAQLLYHAAYDLSSEYASWQAIADLNRQSQEYLRGLAQLKLKIEGTVKQIKDAQAQLKGEAADAGKCSTTAT